MSTGENSEIRVVVSAARPYTGSRSAVIGRYKALQVIRGQFRRDGLQVVPPSVPSTPAPSALIGLEPVS
jgi:hypothetical protein